MYQPCLGEHGSRLTRLIRSRSLRHRGGEVLERAAALRERSGRLVRPAPGCTAGVDEDGRPAGADADPDDVEDADWYRVQLRQVLTAGWSAAELADVGVADGLLRAPGRHGLE